MEFIKIYSTAVPNAARTLEKRVAIAPLLARIKSDNVKAFLELIRNHGELNFWDFGVRATPQLSVDDSVKIICGTTCYSGRVIRIINDPSGELGDQLGWIRQFKAPWKNVCALSINSSTPINAVEIKAISSNARKTADNFYASLQPTRKPEALIEGSIIELTLSTYERDPAARKACLNYYGMRCQACKSDFGETYGDLGRGFIHVHHITPLSKIREAHVVDPIQDLIPVCPNCHAMLHINQGEPLSVEQLRDILARNAKDEGDHSN